MHIAFLVIIAYRVHMSIFHQSLKKLQNNLLKRGFEFKRFYPANYANRRRAVVLQRLGVTHVVDVGANVGQYGLELRELGYEGVIYSLEPMPREFAKMASKAKQDRLWEPLQTGAGDEDKEMLFHITDNSVSSSLLEPLESDSLTTMKLQVQETLTVPVRRLDSLILPKLPKDAKVFLKIDAQGFEDRVLKGASQLLERCVALEMEISFVSFYKGQKDGMYLLNRMVEDGWTPVSFNAECVHPETMAVLQNDVLFVRDEAQIGQA